MIQDQSILEELNAEWVAVEDMLEIIRCSWTEIETPAFQFELSRDLATIAANLCVVFAVSVLERALLHLRDESVFQSKSCTLSSLMLASRHFGLPWRDYNLIDQIRSKRNGLAHKRERFSENECLDMIRAIRIELEAWSILQPKNST